MRVKVSSENVISITMARTVLMKKSDVNSFTKSQQNVSSKENANLTDVNFAIDMSQYIHRKVKRQTFVNRKHVRISYRSGTSSPEEVENK